MNYRFAGVDLAPIDPFRIGAVFGIPATVVQAYIADGPTGLRLMRLHATVAERRRRRWNRKRRSR